MPEVITITIEDDETATVNEGTVGFKRAAMAAGTATEQDYVVASKSISWAASDLGQKSCNFQTRQDTLVEGNEQFRLRLTPISGGAALGIDEMTYTIEDDDRAP